MINSTTKLSITFWVISIVALLWNVMGVIAYLGQAYMTHEELSELLAADQAYYNNVPAWVTAAFALAIFAGIIGCLLLILRKKWATSLFILLFIAILIQFVYTFFMQQDMAITGTALIQPMIVIIVATFLIWYSKKSEEKGWLS